MSEHTPAPWEWVEYEYGFSSLWNPETKEEILHPGGVNDGDAPIVWMGEMLNDADRLLMQASPDMFEVLEMNLRWHESNLRDGPFNPAGPGAMHLLEATEAAIKLAKEGRSKNE